MLSKLWRSATQRVLSLTFVSMLFGLLMDLLLAARLGTGLAAEALVIALSLPLLIDTVGRDGARYSLVPLLLDRQRHTTPQAFALYLSGLVNSALVLGVLLAAALVAAAGWLVPLVGAGLAEAGRAQATWLLQLAAPLVVFAPPITLLSALLNSQKRFTAVAVRNAMAPGAVVLALLLGWQRTDIAEWVALAHSLSFAVFFALVLSDARAAGYRHHWRAWPTRVDAQELLQTVGLPTLSVIVRQSFHVIERSLASLAAPGGAAAYYYALRLVSAGQNLVGSSVATTAQPTLVRLDQEGNQVGLLATLRSRIRLALLLTVPAVVVIVLFHEPLIRLLYRRGAFDETSVQQSAAVFVWLALSLLFSSFIPLLTAVLYARRAYLPSLAVSAVMVAFGSGLGWWLGQSLGLAGVAIASTLMIALNAGGLLAVLHRLDVPVLPHPGHLVVALTGKKP